MTYGMQSPMASTGSKTPKGYKAGRMNNFTPEQMQLFQQLFSQVSPDSNTARLAGGDQSFFEQSEAPALRQFNELQGNIASRFSGMGMGARRSSGFQNTLNSASSNFAQDLQSRRQELQRQAIQDLMGMSTNLLGQRPYENFLVKKSKPWWQEMLSNIGGEASRAGTEKLFGMFGG